MSRREDDHVIPDEFGRRVSMIRRLEIGLLSRCAMTPEFQPQPMLESKLDFGCRVC
jgi:hypothetical protein